MLTQSQQASIKTAKASFLEEANMAYAEIYAEKAQRGENLTVSLEEVKSRLIDENSSYKRTVHVVTNGVAIGIRIKDANGHLVGSSIEEESTSCSTVELVKGIAAKEVANLTLETVGGETSYHAEIKGAFYEMKIENGQIKLTEESELPTGNITYELLATGGSNSTVTTDTDQDSKNITLTAEERTTSPVQITVSYGMNAVVLVSVKGSTTVNTDVVAECKSPVNMGSVYIGTSGTTNGVYEEGSKIKIVPVANTGYKFIKFNDGSTDYTTLTTETEGTLKYLEYTVPFSNSEITVNATFESSLKIGDFVNYDAGTWTSNEISTLQSKGLYSLNNTTGALPTAQTFYMFGGFKEGDSRNESVDTESIYPNVYSGGWRIMSFNDDGTIEKIIHAGTPEGYYHPQGNNSAYKSQWILGGGKNDSAPNVDPNDSNRNFEDIPVRDWSMYVNENYFGVSASNESSIEDNRLFVKVGQHGSIRETNAQYYLSEAESNSALKFVSQQRRLWMVLW